MEHDPETTQQDAEPGPANLARERARGGEGEDRSDDGGPAVPDPTPEEDASGPFHGTGGAVPPSSQRAPSEGISESNPATGL